MWFETRGINQDNQDSFKHHHIADEVLTFPSLYFNACQLNWDQNIKHANWYGYKKTTCVQVKTRSINNCRTLQQSMKSVTEKTLKFKRKTLSCLLSEMPHTDACIQLRFHIVSQLLTVPRQWVLSLKNVKVRSSTFYSAWRYNDRLFFSFSFSYRNSSTQFTIWTIIWIFLATCTAVRAVYSKKNDANVNLIRFYIWSEFSLQLVNSHVSPTKDRYSHVCVKLYYPSNIWVFSCQTLRN
jgi:hypothetical protein